MTSIRSSAILASTILTLGFASPASADCNTRHFYNHSKVTWVLSMGKGACSIGPSGMQSACEIPPGQTASIHYSGVSAVNDAAKVIAAIGGVRFKASGDSIKIASHDGGKLFPVQTFSVRIGDFNECYIKHSGGTGNIVLNDPAHGDVQTCGFDNYGGRRNGYECR